MMMATAFKPPMPRVKMRRADTAARLLEAACDVFAERGFEAASLDAICQRINMTRGAFYSSYASKEDLFIAVFDEEARRLASRLARLWIGVADHPDPLGAAAHRYALTEASDAKWRLLHAEFRLLAARNTNVAERYEAIADQLSANLGQRIADLVDAVGLQLVMPPAEAADLWSAVVEGSSWRHTRVPDQAAETLRKNLFALLGVLTTRKRGALA
ncbi:TetR/AcrR family transcriptional regulator [Sphingopyxis fribergensis]|jgi:AcrR family transcriptional regulator|nr:TetR/AcrR family transcriptional regulator [Sphingopyxis fribergensis]